MGIHTGSHPRSTSGSMLSICLGGAAPAMLESYGIRKLEALFSVLIGTMAVTFGIEFFLSEPSAWAVAGGIAPGAPLWTLGPRDVPPDQISSECDPAEKNCEPSEPERIVMGSTMHQNMLLPVLTQLIFFWVEQCEPEGNFMRTRVSYGSRLLKV
jgi:hypothetical protein